MDKLLKPNGSINRREFLQACGLVVVASASYEAVSLVFGEAKAHAAESVHTHVPDQTLDASLPNAPILETEIQGEMISKSVVDDAVRKARAAAAAYAKKLEVRTPAAICGVRG